MRFFFTIRFSNYSRVIASREEAESDAALESGETWASE